ATGSKRCASPGMDSPRPRRLQPVTRTATTRPAVRVRMPDDIIFALARRTSERPRQRAITARAAASPACFEPSTKSDVDLGAAARPGPQPGVAAMPGRDLPYDGQPRPRARYLAPHGAG